MFNPQTSIDPNLIWEYLGTFYHSLTREEKDSIARYWKALILGMETQFFNLYQENISQFLSLTKGWKESEGGEFDIVFKDKLGNGLENTQKEYLKAPQNLSATYPTTNTDSDKKAFSYKITSLNSEGETLASGDLTFIADGSKVFSTNSIALTWDAVTDATSYNVWGRTPGNWNLVDNVTTNSFTDNGSITPDSSKETPVKNTAIKSYMFSLPKDFFLTITKIFLGDTTLTEGTHYQIIKGNKIRFFTPLTFNDTPSIKGGKYTLGEGLKVLPSLDSIYFPAYGEDLDTIIASGYYKPHIKDWDSGDAIQTYKNRAEHLKNLIWGYSVFTRKAPTMSNLKTTAGLVYDYPFSYEDGTVTDITGRYVTISGSSVYTYDLGDGVTPAVGVSDGVNRFDILASGLNIWDYYNNPTLVSGLNQNLDDPIDQAFVINISSAVDYNPSSKMIKKFKKISIPAGLLAL